MSHFQELKEVVNRQNFVILDTETTGLHDGEICQLAIINPHGDVLLNTLIKPCKGIPMDAARIHGIQEVDVTDAPSWAQVVPTVKLLLQGKDVITYNAVYDRKMFHRSAEHAGMEKIDWKTLNPWYCAMEAFAEFYGEWNDYHQSYKWQRLAVAARHCGVSVLNAHSALGDCLMTLGVINYMVAK